MGHSGEIDEYKACVSTTYGYDSSVIGLSDCFGLPVHGAAKFVDSHDFRMLELVVAACAYAIVAPVVITCASGRAAEEERGAVLTGGEKYPTHAYLVVGKSGRFVFVGICVVRFHPCHEMLAVDRVMPSEERVGIEVAFVKHGAEGMAIGRGSEVHVFSIFGFFHITVLEHFAIDEERVAGHAEAYAFDGFAAGGNVPEVVSLGKTVKRVGGKANVLGCVVTKSAYSGG